MNAKKKVSYKDLALIAGNISKLYEEGIQLLNIFSLLDELPLKKEYKDLLKEMEIMIRDGGTLRKAFSKGEDLIPNFFVSMVGIGEKTGRIVYVLKGLEMYYNKLQYINKTIISSITYPLILMIALIILGFFVLFFFIPSMANIYSAMGKDVPDIYVNIISLKKLVFRNPILILIEVMILGIAVPIFIFNTFLKKTLYYFIDKIPVYNLFNEYISIVLMSVIINSGINIAIGLEYCCEGELSEKIDKVLRKINSDIKNGKVLSESMNETMMFSKYTLAHIKLGEECGSLDKRLIILENEIFNNLSDKITKITVLIQPLLILIIGIVILMFIMKFVVPLLDIVLI